jgi:FHA domain
MRGPYAAVAAIRGDSRFVWTAPTSGSRTIEAVAEHCGADHPGHDRATCRQAGCQPQDQRELGNLRCALPQGSALLVVKRGPNAGSRFLLDQPTTTAGRHPNSDIFLDDITVSRRHAQFRCVSGEFQVVDVGSLNRTYVNREPVDSAVLANGDEVQIGKFRLVFLTGPTTGDTESMTS